jgi:hypothetical protein
MNARTCEVVLSILPEHSESPESRETAVIGSGTNPYRLHAFAVGSVLPITRDFSLSWGVSRLNAEC